jgi:hypothetical protein
MSGLSVKGVQNKIIKLYVDNLARVKSTKIVNGIENYGFIGIDSDLQPFYTFVDNASAEPSVSTSRVILSNNIGTYETFKVLGEWATIESLLSYILEHTTSIIGKAIITLSDIKHEALVLSKYNDGYIYTTIIVGRYIYYANYNGEAWVIRNVDLFSKETKYKEVEIIIPSESAPIEIEVEDADITGSVFVDIMPNDDVDTEIFLSEYLTSNYPVVEDGKFAFSVNNNNGGNPIYLKYLIKGIE